jgi:hypothetical protein
MIVALKGWRLLYPEVREYRQYISFMRTNDWGSDRLWDCSVQRSGNTDSALLTWGLMIGALPGWRLLCPEVSEYRQYISYMKTNDWGSDISYMRTNGWGSNRLEIALSRGQWVQTIHFWYED